MIYAHAYEASEGLAHSWPTVLPEDLPNPLFEAVTVIWTETHRVNEQRQQAAEDRGHG